MKTVDACGMSCPEPLLLLRRALETEKEVLLLVDNRTALDSCRGYVRSKGYAVETVTGDAGLYEIHIAVAPDAPCS